MKILLVSALALFTLYSNAFADAGYTQKNPQATRHMPRGVPQRSLTPEEQQKYAPIEAEGAEANMFRPGGEEEDIPQMSMPAPDGTIFTYIVQGDEEDWNDLASNVATFLYQRSIGAELPKKTCAIGNPRCRMIVITPPNSQEEARYFPF